MSRTTLLLVELIGGGIVAVTVHHWIGFALWGVVVFAHVSYIAAVGREVSERARTERPKNAHEGEERRRSSEVGERQLAQPAAAPQTITRERIIERQVVVMRCKYCAELTPVDLSSCKSCGARL